MAFRGERASIPWHEETLTQEACGRKRGPARGEEGRCAPRHEEGVVALEVGVVRHMQEGKKEAVPDFLSALPVGLMGARTNGRVDLVRNKGRPHQGMKRA